ncbi:MULTISPECIES: penicillin-binding protein 2 [Winkia]|uniref:peptidoglycan D,D-transpeptidase FtsI family protein n=1 Tax=Winkia TaxID=2692118 RepID=UPI0023A9591F|nr:MULTISPECIES: penicillin-binding protein 2 [Winkia]MDK7162462.1 penicillin-binding protein 2 [Winkia sp. UMB3105]MDK8594303.1 penicillin-binding protein 2 [Winkia sp. UMB1096A]WEB56153.1 penicillin-binding protein 2 [Winkia neuii]
MAARGKFWRRVLKRFAGVDRTRWLVLFLATGMCICSLALIKIQVIDGPSLSSQAAKLRTVTYPIRAERGKILDARGTVLATSTQRYNVVANPYLLRTYVHKEVVNSAGKVITNTRAAEGPDAREKVMGTGPVEAARQLAPILEQDRAELGGMLVADSGYQIIARNVEPAKWRKIKELKIEGITSETTTLRSYPAGNTASTVVGFVNQENVGAAGIEASREGVLGGKDGERTVEIAPTGQIIPDGAETTKEAQSGQSLKLSLDADLNQQAQTSLDNAVKKTGATWGTVVVMEVATGRVLALADSGALPPMDAREKSESTKSRVVQSVYEPGSTGKLITFAAALDQGKITPLSTFRIPYEITMKNGEKFVDSHEHGVQNLTASGVLAESSNVGTVQIGDLVSDKSRYQMMKKLGLGEPTGIEMPGETGGLVPTPQEWDGRQRYTTMFGQGIAVSPLQVTQLMATVANGGVRIPARIVDSWTDQNGVVHKTDTPKATRAMEPDTAATLMRMMESVTGSDGTAELAKVPGYRTAGKTGTTEILGGADSGGVVASFVGAAPAEKPAVAVSVVLNKPQTSVYGGVVAAPVFSEVTGAALRMLGVKPSTEAPKLYPIEANTK